MLLTDIVLAFEVHQPFRIKRDYFWEHRIFQRLNKEELFDYYFDEKMNREVFERAARKCYFPSNQIILNAIDEHRHEKRVKVAFSVSGVFLDQCERYDKDVLESFRQLAETGCVEFIGQTYYHSLSGLYLKRDEFVEQVEMHKRAVNDLLQAQTVFFENTEFLYNNAIAKTVETLGFLGIFTEGVERILRGGSPNRVYSAKGCERLKVLLRNYKLTDDIGFRFSSRWWSEWPLTAEKYASWLASTPGECITIFPDYETFGEHLWPETGIHDFLTRLLKEVDKQGSLVMVTPSEAVERNEVVGAIDVPELGGTVSWAGLERDTRSWIGNTMQWAYYRSVRDMEQLVKESQDRDFTRLWRYFQISDHLHHMYTTGGPTGVVHTYFSPFDNPVDAFVTCQAALMDFEQRLRLLTVAANEPFTFYTSIGEDGYTGVSARSLKGFLTALSTASVDSIDFHGRRGDFEEWARFSLRDEELAEKLKKLKGLDGEELRKAIIRVVRETLDKVSQEHGLLA